MQLVNFEILPKILCRTHSFKYEIYYGYYSFGLLAYCIPQKAFGLKIFFENKLLDLGLFKYVSSPA